LSSSERLTSAGKPALVASIQNPPDIDRAMNPTRRLSWYRVSEGITPYLLVAPLIVLVAVFIYWPLIYSAYLSLFDWNFVRPNKEFVGAENYSRLFADPHFETAVRGTVVYTLALIPLQVFLPLALALLLWGVSASRFQGAYRGMLFLPTIVAWSVASVLWLWIFNSNGGVLNQLLGQAGIGGVNWLGERNTAIWSVILVATWKTLGFHMLLYLAALEGVPRDYVEAAQVDGASSFHVMTSIRFPLISPTFFFVLVTTVISVNEDVFAAINVLTDGGPFESTTNVIYYLYMQAFRYFQIGTASTVSVLIFAVTALFTWMQFRYLERHVHYS
jgi:multiple sugar transport system permease protein/sn-glycerol 3-phosphate transport system permease protein